MVVDSNIVVSALIKASHTRELLFHPALELYSPSYLLEEIEKHKLEIMAKAGFGQKEFGELFSAFLKVIHILPPQAFLEYIPDAKQVLKDPADLPFAAAAIALGSKGGYDGDCDIWSNDPDFKKNEGSFFRKFGVKIFTTKELTALIQK